MSRSLLLDVNLNGQKSMTREHFIVFHQLFHDCSFLKFNLAYLDLDAAKTKGSIYSEVGKNKQINRMESLYFVLFGICISLPSALAGVDPGSVLISVKRSTIFWKMSI